MSTWANYLVGLALALPMGAYVAGSLMASAAVDPGNREPVRISDQPIAPRTVEEPRDPERSTVPARTPSPAVDEADHDSDSDSDLDVDVDDNGVRVVTPQPTRLDDSDDDGNGGAGNDDGDDDDDRQSRDDERDDSD